MSTEFMETFSETEFADIVHLYEVDVEDDFDFDFEDVLEVDLSLLSKKQEAHYSFQDEKKEDNSSNLFNDKDVNASGFFNDIACFKGHDLDSIDAKSLEKLFEENPKLDLEEYYDDEWNDLTDSGPINCNHCKSDFISRQEFLLHAFKCFKGNIVEYSCKTCSERFTRFSVFKKHSLRHNPEKYKCLYCDAEFNVQSRLISHISDAHSSIYPYVCSECGLLCPNESVFSLHQKKFHPHLKGYSCNICNRVLYLKKNFIRHVRVHNAGKVYMCDACGKLFLYKLSLMRHLANIHAKKRPFSCNECGKRFPESSYLKRHQKLHTDERPFVCTICAKAFKTRSALNTHSLTHDFTKRFSCSKCNKSFTKISKLKEHENIHTGERPYQCRHCLRSFTNSPNLLKHTKRVHSSHEVMKTAVEERQDSEVKLSMKSNSIIKSEITQKSQYKYVGAILITIPPQLVVKTIKVD